MFTNSSITSLVVPGISVTIALFSPKIELSSEDLPTFGFPTITVFKPSLSIFHFQLYHIIFNFFLSSSVFSLRV